MKQGQLLKIRYRDNCTSPTKLTKGGWPLQQSLILKSKIGKIILKPLQGFITYIYKFLCTNLKIFRMFLDIEHIFYIR
jgi:hypothetical protein